MVGGLESLKLAREPASSRSKPCVSLKNDPKILPVRRCSLAFVGRKQIVVREVSFSPKISRFVSADAQKLWMRGVVSTKTTTRYTIFCSDGNTYTFRLFLDHQ